MQAAKQTLSKVYGPVPAAPTSVGKCVLSLGPLGGVVPITPVSSVEGLAAEPTGGGPIVMLEALTTPWIADPLITFLPTAASVTRPIAVKLVMAMLSPETVTALSGEILPATAMLTASLAATWKLCAGSPETVSTKLLKAILPPPEGKDSAQLLPVEHTWTLSFMTLTAPSKLMLRPLVTTWPPR